MARGLLALLPPIEIVEGSFCNSDPDDPRSWEVRIWGFGGGAGRWGEDGPPPPPPPVK